jgi:hypothetical protein
VPHVAQLCYCFSVYLICKNTSFIFIYIEVIQLAPMCYIPKSLRKKKISRSNLNFDDVETSHENQNFHLRFFVKGETLQYGIRVVCSEAQ